MLDAWKKSAPPFFLSFLGLLLFPAFLPSIRLLTFAPFLTLVIVHQALPFSLWSSLIAGLLVDLYSNGAPIGFFALNYTLTTTIVYRYRCFFSPEKIWVFSLYALLYSLVSTLLHFVLYALIEMEIKLHFYSLLTDLFLMPIADTLYSLAWVFIPLYVYEKITQPKQIRQLQRLVLRYRRALKQRLQMLKVNR